MQPYPHIYAAEAVGDDRGIVSLSSAGLAEIETAAPVEFGGPGDRWSPETLLVAAAADCFVLSFRAIAAASKLAWISLRCHAEGRLDRVDGIVRFTELALRVRLAIPLGGDTGRAQRLLEKSEKSCLITSSLRLTPTLSCQIEERAE